MKIHVKYKLGFPYNLFISGTTEIYEYNISDDIPNYNNIDYIDFRHNKLTELPKLPKHLRYLYCSNNQLTILPELPYTIQEINCSNNQLTLLPELPNSLKFIYSKNNNLIKKFNNNYLYKLF
jgi:Leucine-rich repeat (LRR) protein